MLSKKMEDALNQQINAELYSSYLYLSMAAHFHSVNLPGIANWMEVQAKEENGHGMKLYGYVHDRLGRVALKAIAAPETEWASPLAAFQAVAEHEQKVTGMINKLVEQARDEKDYATDSMLTWFVSEQVEEEASADAIVQQLKMIKDSGSGLLMLDKALAKRGKE